MSIQGKTVVELGPGGSIGVGLAALLSGAARYVGLDVVRHCETQRNLIILDELEKIFDRRVDIAACIPTEDVLRAALNHERVEAIRQEVAALSERDGTFVSYYAPYYSPSVLEPETADILLSHAVMEYVDDLGQMYHTMAIWLKPGGLMQHVVDFRCHGLANSWDGHLAYSDLLWKIIRGNRPYEITRVPLSAHLELAQSAGFEIVDVKRDTEPSSMDRSRLAPRFRGWSDEDLCTSVGFFQARKMA